MSRLQYINNEIGFSFKRFRCPDLGFKFAVGDKLRLVRKVSFEESMSKREIGDIVTVKKVENIMANRGYITGYIPVYHFEGEEEGHRGWGRVEEGFELVE